MKKICQLLFSVASILSFAQTHFGVRTGYSLSNMTFDWQQYGKEKLDAKSYFYVGAFVEHNISEKFALQGELNFTELGGKTYVEMTNIVGNQIVTQGMNEVNFHYPQLQIPLSAKYYPIKKLAFLGGLNFGINLDPNVKFKYYDFFNPSDVDQNNIKTVNIFPFLGTEFHFTEKFFVDARYNFNFFDINQEGLSTKIGIFQIGLGYRFR
ncbi:MAG: PorT family protein [Weeksellaceae bacterium]|nr:PorT family protein [Weeksellaceae bacterium]